MSNETPKRDEDWKRELTSEQYRVTRCGATERAFAGKYWDCKEDGTYRCICCDAALFTSNTKFDSGSGWPSFYAALDKSAIVEVGDTSVGMRRVEVRCASCDAHLGHVFPDGPQPSGMRYCINSASLNLKRKDE